MENSLFNLSIEAGEIISYFSSEVFYIIGIVLNFILLLFFRKKFHIKRLATFVTFGIFFINALILSSIFIKNYIDFGLFDFSILNGSVKISSFNTIVSLLINIFMLLYITATYRIVKKIHFKVPLINSILLLIALTGTILIHVDNFILTYLLFDVLTILIYKYASCMRIRQFSIFSKDYILLGIVSSVLFLSFYFATFLVLENTVQLDILKVCMILAFFLKSGLFPLYNYQITKEYKTNIPYAILLFCFLPCMGVITFNTLNEYMGVVNEVYQVPVLMLMFIAMFSFALFAVKQKNVVTFCANLSCFVNVFCIMHILYFPSQAAKSIGLAGGFAFALLGFFATVCILWLNTDSDRVSINSYKGLFLNNRFYSFITAFLLLMLTFIIPSSNSSNVIEILKDIYSYDKTGMYILVIVFFAQFAILFKAFEIIKNIYFFDKNNIKDKLVIKAAYVYAAPVIVTLFLLIKIFL